jgi:hypothetical protein
LRIGGVHVGRAAALAAAESFASVVELAHPKKRHHSDSYGHALNNRQFVELQEEQNQAAERQKNVNEYFFKDRKLSRPEYGIKDIKRKGNNEQIGNDAVIMEPLLHGKPSKF